MDASKGEPRPRSTLDDGDPRTARLLRALPVALAVCDPAGRIVLASDALARLVGMPAGAVVGATPPYPWWPGGHPGLMGLEPEGDGEHHLVWTRRDGRRLSVAVALAPLDGGAVAAVRELPDAGEAREMRALVRSMDDGLAVVDQQGRQVLVSDRMCAMTGFSRDELVGRTPPFPYWPEEEAGAIQAALAQTLATGEGVFDLVFRRASGERFPARIWVTAVSDGPGPRSFLAAVRDLTDLRRAERGLRATEASLEALGETSPAAMYLADVAGGVTFMSRAWQDLTGSPPAAAHGAGLPDAVHPGDLPAREAAVATGAPYRCRVRVRDGRGGWRWVDDHAGPRLGPGGEVTSWAGAVVDVSDRVAAEEQERARERLLAAAAEATGLLLREGASPAVLEPMLGVLARATGAGRGVVWQAAAPSPTLEPAAEWTSPGVARLGEDPALRRLDVQRVGATIVAEMLRTRAAWWRVADEVPRSERGFFRAIGVRSIVGAPIVVDGSVWGVIGLHHLGEERRWGPADLDALMLVAGSVGAAVARERAEAATREERARFRAAMDGSPDHLTFYRAVRDESGRLVDLELQDANPTALQAIGASTVEQVAGARLFELFPALLETGLLEECREVVETGRLVEGETVGVGGAPQSGTWLWYRLAPLGDGLAMTTRDVSDLRRREAEEAALRRVATAVAEGRSPEELFALVATEAMRLHAADGAGVSRWDGGDFAEEVGTAGGMAPPAGTRVPLAGGSATALALRTGRPARLDDYAHLDPETRRALLGDGEPGSSVAAPVSVHGRIWGAIRVVSRAGVHLPAAAEGNLGRFAELVALAVQNAEDLERLQRMAATDPLTRLANHRTFQERLATEVARAERHGRPLALALLDLDRFKELNDGLGHAAGDEALAEVARRLAAAARPGDLVARVGGEEFAWILPETDAEGARQACERARRGVAEATVGPAFATITLSAGVCDLVRARSGDALFGLADGALYWAKTHGRDRVVVYAPEVVRELSADERAERLERSRALIALRALARAVDAKDHHTLEHSERVAEWAALVATELGWDAGRVEALREAALVHDVGKIGVPDAALFAPGPPDEEGWRLIRQHAALGAEIVSEALSPEQAAWVRHHHERWDGTGYPAGLRGGEIPEGAAVLALADAWDAMTTDRHYRPALRREHALREVEACAGAQFEPRAAAALLALAARQGPQG